MKDEQIRIMNLWLLIVSHAKQFYALYVPKNLVYIDIISICLNILKQNICYIS